MAERDPQRRLGSDRRRPAVDRRPVSAREDPPGQGGRDPRVHRLQRLHLQGRQPAPHRLHPEPDRRRGAPARMASGARAAAGRSPCTRWWWGRGRAAWSARSRWLGAARGSTWSTGARWWAARWAGSRACRGSASGAGWWRTGRCSSKRLPGIELTTGRELDADEIRGWGADVVVLATGSSWAGDGLNGFTREPDPGRRRRAAARADAGAGAAGGQAAAGPAVSWSTTATATSRRRGWPSCWPARGTRWSWSPATRTSRRSRPRRWRTCSPASGCTRREWRCAAPPRWPESSRGVWTPRDEFGEPFTIAADARGAGHPAGLPRRALPRAGRHAAAASTGSETASRRGCWPRSMFDGHRLAREIDQPDPDVALPYLRERPMQDPPPAPAPPPEALTLPERVQPRPRRVELLEGAAGEVAARIDQLVRGRGEVVVAAGRGAGDDLEPYRRLAERYGGRFAVSRPQVEAGARHPGGAGRRLLPGGRAGRVSGLRHLGCDPASGGDG